MEDVPTKPFYLENGRAMVSLGPLGTKRHCRFRCPFCYVESREFVRYRRLSPEAIVEWVEARLSDVRIIYVSGDTDSFAPPRTDRGLRLLEGLARLGRHLSFTTRHVFETAENWARIAEVAATTRRLGMCPIASVSVCQRSVPTFEPPPIRPAIERIEQLGRLAAAGWVPVLAMRPIMPGVPLGDFEEILRLASEHTRYCLIADYYYDPAAVSQWRPPEGGASIGGLDFDLGAYDGWRTVTASDVVRSGILAAADRWGMTLAQRSTPLFEDICQRHSGIQ